MRKGIARCPSKYATRGFTLGNAHGRLEVARACASGCVIRGLQQENRRQRVNVQLAGSAAVSTKGNAYARVEVSRACASGCAIRGLKEGNGRGRVDGH